MCYDFKSMKVLGIALLVGLVFCSSGLAAEKVEEQAKLQKIQEQLKESRQKLQQTKQQQQEVLGKLVVITSQLRQANKKLNQAKEKIVVNESRIGQLTSELRQTQGELEKNSGLMAGRIQEAYKSSGTNYFDLVFGSRSMSDFLNRMYFFEKIIGQDTRLVEEIKGDLRMTKSRREVLSDRTQEIKELSQVIVEQKKEISEQAQEKKKVFESLKEREAEYENRIAELERSSRELEVLIQKKMAERSKAGIVARGSGTLVWPLKGRITSRYGVYRRRGHHHTGVDIAAPHGTPIVAADGGEVIFSGWWDGYGKALVIDHGRGRTTVYGHMSRIYLQVGAQVAKGQTIGLEGSTGYSTGPHLHFEVRKNGTPVNPMPFLP